MKTLVAYATRSGATEQYARWLAESLLGTLKKFEDVTAVDFDMAESVYVLSGTYGGQMPLTKFINDNWHVLQKKKVVAIAVGMAPEGHWWSKVSRLFMPRIFKKEVKFYKLLGWVENDPKTRENVKRENLERIIRETS